ncbi:MAG: ABC transporter permease [Anaerolineae bacterium]|nr:ABC transporter permease [Anaerolineae bacterium]
MFDTVIQSIFSATFLASILRVTTPILLASLGALVSDRAGAINIGLEGTMLASAFTGAVVSAFARTWFAPEVGVVLAPWIGMICGLIVAVTFALILAFFHLRLKADLILSGVAINILGSAGTVAVLYALTGNRGDTGDLPSLQMPFVRLPFLQNIPLIGNFLYGVLDNQSIMTWIAGLAVLFLWFLLYRTSFGIHLRAVGENASAAESVGIPVTRTRYWALILSGLFAGLGGIHMSMGYLSLFQRDMTSGRGFIALATPLLGNNNPLGTAIASLVFGFFEALGIRLGTLQIPSMLPQMIPFIATVMALAIYALQRRQTLRVRALRAAEGEGFNASYWRSVQRLSLLHVLLGSVAVIGIIIAISMFAAPNGFGGVASAYPIALVLTAASIVLIVMNIPFVSRVENIGTQTSLSGIATVISVTAYLGLFLTLFLNPVIAFAVAALLGLLLWGILGGLSLLQMSGTKVKPA